MGDIVNLNRARKARIHAAQESSAAENRVRFGRTKEDKALDKARAEQAAQRLDQLRRTSDEPDA